MKFEIKHNIFATGVKKVNLSEQEADYIVALASGVEKDKILKTLSLTETDIENLYNKFGLKDKNLIRDNQLITLCIPGNFLGEYFELNAKREFIFPECQELLDGVQEMQKNDTKFKKEIEEEVEKMIDSQFKKEKKKDKNKGLKA